MYNSLRGARDDPERDAATSTCPASSSAWDRKCRRGPTRRVSGRSHKINRPFAIYIGRIDENKGCSELFDYFQRYATTFPRGLDLVLVGKPIIPMPTHPRIHHLGFLPDEDKFDALAAADLLIMPSYFESLSMVALEAWALGRPVLANGRCDVLQGPVHPQQRRAVLRDATRSSPRRCYALEVERAAARAPRARTAATTSGATTPGR